MEDSRYSKIGKVYNGFGTFQLKSVLIKNDAGDWGTEPNENAVGIIRSTNFNNNGKLDLSDIAYRTLSPQKFEDKKLSSSDILIFWADIQINTFAYAVVHGLWRSATEKFGCAAGILIFVRGFRVFRCDVQM